MVWDYCQITNIYFAIKHDENSSLFTYYFPFLRYRHQSPALKWHAFWYKLLAAILKIFEFVHFLPVKTGFLILLILKLTQLVQSGL